MIKVPIDVAAIKIIWDTFKLTALKIPEIPGTNKTKDNRITPIPNAPKINLLLKNLFVNKTGFSDLQLKPWINLDRQMLANAIVLPVSFEVLRPYKKQITAAAAIISPSEITLN